jgi:hypothetical protein
MADFRNGCIVMFSGGRDSTIAAVRLSNLGVPLQLVTVSSGHLLGIDNVRGRLAELKSLLPPTTRWLRVRQPNDLRTDTSFYEMTCLPCHHSYVVASGVIAASSGIHRLAFGYTQYQSSWPEQTPLAIERLRLVLARHGILLELPVYDLASRDSAIQILGSLGISSASLEQKCIQQISNVTLSAERLKSQIDLWEQAIEASMARLSNISLEVLEETELGELS